MNNASRSPYHAMQGRPDPADSSASSISTSPPPAARLPRFYAGVLAAVSVIDLALAASLALPLTGANTGPGGFGWELGVPMGLVFPISACLRVTGAVYLAVLAQRGGFLETFLKTCSKLFPYAGQKVDSYIVSIDHALIFCGLRELHDPNYI